MAIDEIFQDNLKEKLAGVLKEIPESHLKGLKEVSLECLNGKQLKIDEDGELGCCFLDGRICLDYYAVASYPDIVAEHIFLHELGHNIFKSLLPFKIKHKWAKACRKNNFIESPQEIFAEEYKSAVLWKNGEYSLYNSMEEVLNFLENNKERKCNGLLHKVISHVLYSKESKAKSI